MASGGDYKFLEGNEDSNTSASNSELKAKNGNNRRLAESCPPVLEPSKDESRHSDGRPKNRPKNVFTRSCPLPSTQQVSISSTSESYSHEEEQQRITEPRRNDQPTDNQRSTNEPQTNCCASVWDCYNKFSRKIKDSCFIYIFQLFISLLCISAIAMGIIHFQSCEGRYPATIPVFSILTGLSGLFIIYKWLAKVCRERRGEYYWNHERNRLILYLVVVLFFMALEFMFFTQISSKTLLFKTDSKCTKQYYDYLYNMHIAIAAVIALVCLLYLPDCFIYISTYRHLVPSPANGHYQPL